MLHRIAWYGWRRWQMQRWLMRRDFLAGADLYRLARQLVATNLAGMRDHPELARDMVTLVRQAERLRANGRLGPCAVCAGTRYLLIRDRLVNCIYCKGTGQCVYPKAPTQPPPRKP